MLKEAEIEKDLIKELVELKYTYRPDISNEQALKDNFRQKFQLLNKVNLTDKEFARLWEEIITDDVFKASKILRTTNTFFRDDETPLHYTLVNTKDWCKNEFEVINQLRINTQKSYQRYDVIILINGIPIVQIELKGLEVTPRKAMQQIVDYKKDAGNGYTNSLLCFMQLFVVSNRSNTYYFANNNNHHFSFNADEKFLPVYQWADENNKKITHLFDFCKVFLNKCTLAEMISKYMVLVETEQKILPMRPYQIYAVKNIIKCIDENRGNGYIWHTTGSGKTLTSFKVSTLLKDNPNIHKCLFVVDRKDLDRQTRQEFNKFQKDCVEENTSTEKLVERMLSEDYADKIIVTTIQKLAIALDSSRTNSNYVKRLEKLRNKRIVFIFDECHRSQFGENHKAIKKFFENAQLFGFTGTPIFEDNASYTKIDGTQGAYVTTKDVFQKQLHAYTITHAIEDKNVLRFHVAYFKPEIPENTINPDSTKRAVVNAILEKHDTATNRRRFNAIFATSSINDAIAYYELFKEIQSKKKQEDENFLPLNVFAVFSPPDMQQLQEDLQQEAKDLETQPNEKENALQNIIAEYNQHYGTNFTVANFDLYYQDIQQRIKSHQYSYNEFPRNSRIDIVIVVDMLLTGFDSKYLNTLYVDKNLEYHSLIQAFSRTNRVLNDTKPYGNILVFRELQRQVNDAIVLFSGENVSQPQEIWLVEEADKVIKKYQDTTEKLNKWMQNKGLAPEPHEVFNIKGDVARAEFINLFKEIQRIKTQLDQYTDLTAEQKQQIEAIFPQEKLTEFKSAYLEIAKQLRKVQQEQDYNAPNEIQQLDFEFVLFASALIDYDYIMNLIAKYTQQNPKKIKLTPEQLINLLSSSANLMEEKEDIQAYIETLQIGIRLSEQEVKRNYYEFKKQRRAEELARIAHKNHLPLQQLEQFVQNILNRMIFDADALTQLFEPLHLTWKERKNRETTLMKDLIPFLKKQTEGKEISGLKAYEQP
ncbi:MAG: type I restriction endonuclease subunit R [Microscillaceae bacterium]|nr:type I restriction endonuclease subunit R [Microscillaceae bacterium]MDW8460284.1 type I restriction endonuclease subunit R [Cytophagales bacterium]